MRFIQRIRMPGLLSFPPDMDFFDLRSLNVLIGPNGSGKSNFIEALELSARYCRRILRAASSRWRVAPTEWLWKGSNRPVNSGRDSQSCCKTGTPTKRPI